MQFWQNQLQFPLWCATAGCGVSVKDHLLNENLRPLARSFFRFHVYYQTRRILAEMKCPSPARDSWNAFNNGIDHHAYQRICGEFVIDYKQAAAACHLSNKHMASNGLGNTFVEWRHSATWAFWHNYPIYDWYNRPVYATVKHGDYNPQTTFSSAYDSKNGRFKYISQEYNDETSPPSDIENGFV